jgi:hypothetical protein
LAFDNGQFSTWNAGGIDTGGSTYLILPFANADVWKWVARASIAHFAYQGQRLTNLPLTGTTIAINTVSNCWRKCIGRSVRQRLFKRSV